MLLYARDRANGRIREFGDADELAVFLAHPSAKPIVWHVTSVPQRVSRDPAPGPPTVKHGTHTAYNGGCRCYWCVSFRSDYAKAYGARYRARKRAEARRSMS
jgi:hypothetical protein